MELRTLGRTDIAVSTVCMGCWAIAGGETWGKQDERDSIAAIRASLEAGVNFFDTAEAYGDGYSEELLGRVLSPHRKDVVIATKVSRAHLSRKAVVESCEASLRRLKTDYIDLYQVHWANPEVPLSETLEALQELKAKGKVRAIGVSNFGIRDLSALVELGWVESDQMAYSLLFRAIEFEVAPFCLEKGISIIAYSPLSQGLLTGKFSSPEEVPQGRARTRHFSSRRPGVRHGESGCEKETFAAIEKVRAISEKLGMPMAQVALRWVLEQPAVTCVIAGARNASQARENAMAGELVLPQEALDELSAVTEKLKDILGANPDMWESDGRIR